MIITGYQFFYFRNCAFYLYTRSILKKISDVVALGTFCYRDQSFINRRGGGGFTEGEVLN